MAVLLADDHSRVILSHILDQLPSCALKQSIRSQRLFSPLGRAFILGQLILKAIRVLMQVGRDSVKHYSSIVARDTLG